MLILIDRYAAACCNEAFKIATSTNPYLQNYMFVMPGAKFSHV